MNMLTTHIMVTILQYVFISSHHIHTWNFHSVICHLYLNNLGGKVSTYFFQMHLFNKYLGTLGSGRGGGEGN